MVTTTADKLNLLKQLSPHQGPAKVGQVAIIMEGQRCGYCIIVKSTVADLATVQFLDAKPGDTFSVDLYGLIPTGKTPADLMKRFWPSDQALGEAVSAERGPVDYSRLTSTKAKAKAKSTTKKPTGLAAKVAGLSPSDKQRLMELIAQAVGGKGD